MAITSREQARHVFMEIADLPVEDRRAALARACGDDASLQADVETLLRADEQAGRFMDAPTGDFLLASAADAATIAGPQCEGPGTRIGPYKILQAIGEGGFGSVFMAEQEKPVSRKVALKIIKLGMDTRQVVARFEQERQALAMMDHPNIARVLDAGATDNGRPFFVMELCKGDPIVEYCDKNHLSIQDRLELFAQVCNAVQHAHTKGIIHRDIKPPNILVSTQDGRPHAKVIDFGIAKATASKLTDNTLFTEHKALIGTPVYMSPEQAEGSLDIDTRTDVYSLGVLLYELLTGTTPFSSKELRSAAYAEIQRIIREVEPPKPSTRISQSTGTIDSVAARRHVEPRKLGPLVRGELDWIVMKALEKDRQRRYETANELAADIVRHLRNEPVTAGPPSVKYKMAKFVKRNKAQVVAGGAIAALLVLGVVGTSYGMVWALSEKGRADEQATLAMAAADSERTAKREAEESAQRAIEEAHRAEAAEAQALARAEQLELVADFQAGQLSAIEPEAMGANLCRSIIDAAPEAERDALAAALAPINFTSIALSTLEDNIFERTIGAIDTQFETQPLVQARLLQTVAETLRGLGLLDIATDPQMRALAIRHKQLGDDHPDTLSSLNSLGALLQAQGKLAEAEPNLGKALEGNRRVLGDDHPSTLTSLNNMGFLLQAQGKLAEAEAYYREALTVRRRVLGDDHPNTLNSLNSVGALLWSQGKLTEAEPYVREALEVRRRVLGDDHPSTLTSINNMGFLLRAQRKLAEAEAYYREALDGRRRVLGDDHPDTLSSVNNMVILLRAQERLTEAEPYAREALEGRRRVLGDDHPSTLTSINNMGYLLRDLGRLAEAEACYREALDGSRRVLGDDHPNTLTSINNMGALLRDQGKLAEAEACYREALDGSRRVLGDDHPNTLRSIHDLGTLLQAQHKLVEAEPYVREALEGRRRVLGDDHPETLASMNHLAASLIRLQNYHEAEVVGVEHEIRSREVHGPTHNKTTDAINLLIDLYTAWHEAEPDAGHDAKAAEWRATLAREQAIPEKK